MVSGGNLCQALMDHVDIYQDDFEGILPHTIETSAGLGGCVQYFSDVNCHGVHYNERLWLGCRIVGFLVRAYLELPGLC